MNELNLIHKMVKNHVNKIGNLNDVRDVLNPVMDYEIRVVKFLDVQDTYVTFSNIQASLNIPQPELIKVMRTLFQTDRVDYIPSNGFSNSRYKLKKKILVNFEVVNLNYSKAIRNDAISHTKSKSTDNESEYEPLIFEIAKTTKIVEARYAKSLSYEESVMDSYLVGDNFYFLLSDRPKSCGIVFSIQKSKAFAQLIIGMSCQSQNIEDKKSPQESEIESVTLFREMVTLRLKSRPSSAKIKFSLEAAKLFANVILKL